MRHISLLGLHCFQATLEIGTRDPFALVHARHEHGRVGEEIVHLLEGALGGLGQKAVEENRVREVANLRLKSVVLPAVKNGLYSR